MELHMILSNTWTFVGSKWFWNHTEKEKFYSNMFLCTFSGAVVYFLSNELYCHFSSKIAEMYLSKLYIVTQCIVMTSSN